MILIVINCDDRAVESRACRFDCPSCGGLAEEINRMDDKAGMVSKDQLATRPTQKVGHDEDTDVRPRVGNDSGTTTGSWTDVPQPLLWLYILAFQQRIAGFKSVRFREAKLRSLRIDKTYRANASVGRSVCVRCLGDSPRWRR